MAKRKASKNGSGANLGFEEKLWAAADKLRGHMDAAEYKHVVLGRIYDPCCGSGGMFVQSEKFVLAHGEAARSRTEHAGVREADSSRAKREKQGSKKPNAKKRKSN